MIALNMNMSIVLESTVPDKMWKASQGINIFESVYVYQLTSSADSENCLQVTTLADPMAQTAPLSCLAREQLNGVMKSFEYF